MILVWIGAITLLVVSAIAIFCACKISGELSRMEEKLKEEQTKCQKN